MRLFYCYICFSSRLIFFPSLVDLQEATVICSICISAVQPNLLLMPTTQDTQTHIWEVVLLAGGRPGCRGNCRVRSPATAAPELGLITAHPPPPTPPLSLFFWRFFFSSFLTSSSPVSFFLPVTVPHLATREGRAREERQTKNFSHYCLLNEQKCLENWGPILSEQLPLFLTIVFAAVQQFFCLFFIIIFCCWSECFFFLLTVKSWLSLCCSQKTSSWPVRWREHRWNWQTLVWPSRCRETSRPGLVRILLCFLLVSLINGTETERKWSECLMWCDSVDVGPGGSYQAPATEKRKWCKNKLLYSSTSVCYSWSWYFFSLNTLI